jgi:hypothetical protein
VNIAGSVIAGVDQVANHQGLGRCAAHCFEFGARGDHQLAPLVEVGGGNAWSGPRSAHIARPRAPTAPRRQWHG